jgi:hypothetical protein
MRDKAGLAKKPTYWRIPAGFVTAFLLMPVAAFGAGTVLFHDPITPIGTAGPFSSVSAKINNVGANKGDEVVFTFTPAPGTHVFLGKATDVDVQVLVDWASGTPTVNGPGGGPAWKSLNSISGISGVTKNNPVVVTVGNGIPGTNNMFNQTYSSTNKPPATANLKNALLIPTNAKNVLISARFEFLNTSLNMSSTPITLTLDGQ